MESICEMAKKNLHVHHIEDYFSSSLDGVWVDPQSVILKVLSANSPREAKGFDVVSLNRMTDLLFLMIITID